MRKNSTPTFSPGDALRWLTLAAICLCFLVFSTINTTAFIVPKSLFLRACAFALAAGFVISRGTALPANPLNFPLFCLGGAILASVFASTSPLVSFIRFSEYMAYFIIFHLTASLFDRRGVRSLADSIVFVSVPMIVYGLFQYMQIDFAFWERPEGRMDLFSTVGNVNWYGAFLVGLIPLAAWSLYGNAGSKARTVLDLSVLFLAISTVIMTYSRAAFFAMAISLAFGAVLLVVMNRGSIPARALRTAGIMFVLAAIVAAVFSSYNFISSRRFAEGGFLARMKSGLSVSDHNVAQRLFVWRVTAEMFREKPLLGIGAGMFKVHYLDNQKRYLDSLGNDPGYDEIAGNAKEAHNEFVQMAAECGIAGLACMVFFFGSVFFRAIRFIADQTEDYSDRAYALALLVSLSGLMLDAMADFPLHVPCNGAFIFALCGALAVFMRSGAAADGAREEKKEEVTYSTKAAAIAVFGAAMLFLVILPFAADTMTVTGQSYLKAHDFKSAIPYLERAMKLNPAQGDAIYLLGTAHIGLAAPQGTPKADGGRLAYGKELLLKARAVTSDKGIYNNLGFVSLRRNELAEAAAFFEHALGCDPKSPDSLNNLGIVRFHLGDLEKAEAYYQKCLRINPFFITAINNLGDLETKRGKADRALEYYGKVIKLTVREIIDENRRRNIFNFNEATIDSEKARAAYQCGEIHGARGALREALEMYRLAGTLVSGMPQIPLKTGMTMMKLGMREEGRRIVEEALRSIPEGSDYRRQAAEILSRY